ncbi:MAG: histidine phosphatase family protein [Gammaproteobacteria bacterium]|nr:MAG: histidine phosphatase family protein [Gammaproteobacteria bacterium]
MAIRELIFLRHGQTEWNADGRLQGRGDSPLTPLGRSQVEAHLDWLASRRPQRLLTSPLGRARATAAILADTLGLEVETDPRLMERSMGGFEGWTLAEIEAASPDDISARARDPWNYRAPGGENYDDMSDRVRPLVDDLLASPPERVVVVSHGTLVRALLCQVLELDRDTTLRLHQPNAIGYVVRLSNGAPEILRFGGNRIESGLLLYD